MMRYFSLFLLSFFLWSCGTKAPSSDEETSQDTTEVQPEKPQRPYAVVARLGKFPESKEFVINTAVITGNTLEMRISYTGGCGMHDFEFIGNEAILKSMPPQRMVKLIHQNTEDACESLVNQVISVDLRAVAYSQKPGSEIVLLLDGWKEPLTYKYE